MSNSNTPKNFHSPECHCNKWTFEEHVGSDCQNEICYQNEIRKLDSIELLIVGNEPYPSGSNGIAFCKNTWPELMDGRCGGRYLLCSIGLDLGGIQSKYNSPVLLFMQMAKKGIVCVNQNDELLSEILKKKPNISITCGSKILEDVKKEVKKCSKVHLHCERHPSPQGESNPPDKTKDWFKYWGKFENLLSVLEPDNSNGVVHTAIKELNQKGNSVKDCE